MIKIENIFHAIYILGGLSVILGVVIALFSKKTSAKKDRQAAESQISMPPEAANIKRVARVRCSGASKYVRTKFNYEGISDCVAASKLMGGHKLCPYACLGHGTCANSCKNGAISLKDGIAHINAKKCQACGKCVESCPKKVIALMNDTRSPWVKCSSRNQDTVVRQICDIGCIGCKICKIACTYDAIKIENDLAKIDQTKCKSCAACIAKCPRRVIAT
jgi:electron transport complex protein RnfB